MSTAAPPSSIDRNIELACGFAQLVARRPELLEVIPEGAVLVVLPMDDLDRYHENIELGMKAVEQGSNVYFMHVDTLE